MVIILYRYEKDNDAKQYPVLFDEREQVIALNGNVKIMLRILYYSQLKVHNLLDITVNLV